MSSAAPNFEQLLGNAMRAFSGNMDNDPLSTREVMNSFMNLSDSGMCPPCDVVENEEEMLIYLDVPGIDKSTVDVDFRNNKMIIKGTRYKPYDHDTRRSEISYGNFEKKISIPMIVSCRENVKVTLKNGVLKIRIDKCAENENGFHVRLGETNDDS